MCEPTSITYAVVAVAGIAMSAYSQQQQAKAAAKQSDFSSQVAANNAKIAANNAEIALGKGEADIEDQKLRTKQRIGLQTAQLAAQGFDVSGGSSIEILGDTAALGELDVLRIDADAQNRAANFRNQSANFQSESNLGRFAAKNQRRAGNINAASTLITGASRAGSGFLDLKSKQSKQPKKQSKKHTVTPYTWGIGLP